MARGRGVARGEVCPMGSAWQVPASRGGAEAVKSRFARLLRNDGGLTIDPRANHHGSNPVPPMPNPGNNLVRHRHQQIYIDEPPKVEPDLSTAGFGDLLSIWRGSSGKLAARSKGASLAQCPLECRRHNPPPVLKTTCSDSHFMFSAESFQARPLSKPI
jgi:hypothetical protein